MWQVLYTPIIDDASGRYIEMVDDGQQWLIIAFTTNYNRFSRLPSRTNKGPVDPAKRADKDRHVPGGDQCSM